MPSLCGNDSYPGDILAVTDEKSKLLLCALSRNDVSTATSIVHNMTESAKQEPMTIYLLFKLALQSDDNALASECLDLLRNESSSDPRFLYACCLAAQSAQHKMGTIIALKSLIAQHDFTAPSPVHLPALLRSVIRLEATLLDETENTAKENGTPIEDVCNLFELGRSFHMVRHY
jgi:hypothetical protein